MAGPGLTGLAGLIMRSAVRPGQAARFSLGRSAAMTGAGALRRPGALPRPVGALCPAALAIRHAWPAVRSGCIADLGGATGAGRAGIRRRSPGLGFRIVPLRRCIPVAVLRRGRMAGPQAREPLPEMVIIRAAPRLVRARGRRVG